MYVATQRMQDFLEAFFMIFSNIKILSGEQEK